MDFDDLKDDYKNLNLGWRFLASLCFGCLIPAYFYYMDADEKELNLQNAIRDEAFALDQLQKNQLKKNNIEALEEKRLFVQEQLNEARKKLPDAYQMDHVLRTTASLALDSDIMMEMFEPQAEKKGQGAYPYMMLPIKLQVKGAFNKVIAFFDRIVHLEKLVHLDDMELISSVLDTEENNNPSSEGSAGKTPSLKVNTSLTDEEKVVNIREEIEVVARTNMVLYRSADQVAQAKREETPQDDKGDHEPAKQ